MPKTFTKNLHVPLPEPLYRQLRAEAERERRPATDIAREAIYHWLNEQQRLLVHESIREYAALAGGSAADLDETLEAAATDHLREAGDDEGLAS